MGAVEPEQSNPRVPAEPGGGEPALEQLEALLATKLAPPVAASGLLARPDLVALLNTAGSAFSLISAPAGWGKSSLLTAWHEAESPQRRFAFVRLEPADDDISVVWSLIVNAVRTVHPRMMAGTDDALRTPGVDPMRHIVPSLINELCAVGSPMVLVLDDYHVVTAESVHESIRHLIDHMPPAVQLAIATRVDPPLGLGGLRVSGDMTEVRARQLGLSEAETAQLMDERFDVQLDAATVRLLRRRTEGWPAAIHLAGLSLQHEADARGFVERFAGDDRNVADYLTGEVLHQLSPEQREFLLRTSVLDHLTGALCDAVADVSGAAATLEELERSNLFIVPLDNRRVWYRYHHMFAEWLSFELRKTWPESISVLHRTASEWHAEHGSIELAVNHAIAAGEYEAAAGLIDRYLGAWTSVFWSRVRRWLDQLPPDVKQAHTVVALAESRLAMTHGDFLIGLAWLDAAEEALDALPAELHEPISRRIQLWRALAELVVGDLDRARELSLNVANQDVVANSIDRAGAIGIAGIATFWSHGALQAIPLLQEAEVARGAASIADGGVTSLLSLAYAEIGDWSAAVSAADRAFGLPPTDEQSLYPDLLHAHYAMGKVLAARNDPERGREHIEQGLGMARAWVEPIFIAYGCLLYADLAPDFVEKRALVREARQLIDGGRGRGRITEMVTAAEHMLSIRRPRQRSAGTVQVEALTARELDVVRLLRSGLSLREIGGELYISHNTVKGYTRSIYQKLGASSREGAVEIARELGLL